MYVMCMSYDMIRYIMKVVICMMCNVFMYITNFFTYVKHYIYSVYMNQNKLDLLQY